MMKKITDKFGGLKVPNPTSENLTNHPVASTSVESSSQQSSQLDQTKGATAPPTEGAVVDNSYRFDSAPAAIFEKPPVLGSAPPVSRDWLIGAIREDARLIEEGIIAKSRFDKKWKGLASLNQAAFYELTSGDCFKLGNFAKPSFPRILQLKKAQALNSIKSAVSSKAAKVSKPNNLDATNNRPTVNKDDAWLYVDDLSDIVEVPNVEGQDSTVNQGVVSSTAPVDQPTETAANNGGGVKRKGKQALQRMQCVFGKPKTSSEEEDWTLTPDSSSLDAETTIVDGLTQQVFNEPIPVGVPVG